MEQQMPDEKNSRLNVRLSESQRKALKDAAAITGTSVSDFVLMPAVERAHQVLAAERVTHIQADAAVQFLEWLDEPPRVIPEMKPLADAEPFQRP